MKGLSKGRYDETFAGEDVLDINQGTLFISYRLCPLGHKSAHIIVKSIHYNSAHIIDKSIH